jgi:hypothetical protein
MRKIGRMADEMRERISLLIKTEIGGVGRSTPFVHTRTKEVTTESEKKEVGVYKEQNNPKLYVSALGKISATKNTNQLN